MMEAIPWKKTWIDPIVCLALRSPGLKRRKDSGRDRWVGPRQQQAPSRQRESREQWGTWWIWSFSKMSHAYSIYVQLYMHKVQEALPSRLKSTNISWMLSSLRIFHRQSNNLFAAHWLEARRRVANVFPCQAVNTQARRRLQKNFWWKMN